MKEFLAPQGTFRFVVDDLPDDDGTQRMGQCDQEDRIIKINRNEICCPTAKLDTQIHEEIHGQFAEFNEREVKSWTKAFMKEITPSQKKFYHNLYARKTTT